MKMKTLSLALAVCLLAAGCETLPGSEAGPEAGGALYVADASNSGPGNEAAKKAGKESQSRPNSSSPPAPDAAVTMTSNNGRQVAAAPASLTESLHKALGQVKDQRARINAQSDTISELKEKLAVKEQEVKQLKEDLNERDDRVRKLQEAVDKWKQDILGYRDEMRQAEEAEMKALTRIIALLKKCSRARDSETGGEE